MYHHSSCKNRLFILECISIQSIRFHISKLLCGGGLCNRLISCLQHGKLHPSILPLLQSHVSFDSTVQNHSFLMLNSMVAQAKLAQDYQVTGYWKNLKRLTQFVWRNGWKPLINTRLMWNLGVIMHFVCLLFYHSLSAKSNAISRS